MSANLLERVTPGPWRADGLDIRVDDDAPVATANISRLRCSFNAELIALAYDHALLLRALMMQVARLMEDPEDGPYVFVCGPPSKMLAVVLDAAGCPLLTHELREALRRAIGIEAANG